MEENHANLEAYMMKKLLALLMVLVLLPAPFGRAHAEDDAVEAAMLAYAKTAIRPYQFRFDQLTDDGTLAFRTTVDKVYGRDDHGSDKNALMNALVTLGFTVTENDNVWLLDKNQVELNLRYLMYLSQLETMPFEDAVDKVKEYMPDYNLGKAALGVAADVFLNLLGNKLGDMVQADGIVFALDFRDAGKKLLDGNFLSRTLGKALVASSGHLGDIYKGATTMSEAAKSLSGYVADDPALLNLINSVNQAVSGASYLEAMYAGGLITPEMNSAVGMLSSAYKAYLDKLDELGQRKDAHELLQNEDYLAQHFDQILQNKLAGYGSAYDACTAILAGVGTIYDIIQYGGWGSIIVMGGTNVVGEAVFGTASTYTHFHAMVTLDEIFASMESAAGADRSTWQDYAAYARNIQRLCNIALLGESHIYQLTTEDIGAGQKLWNLLKYKMTGEDMLAQNAQWYDQRVEFLQTVYNGAQDYLDALYAHYDQLLMQDADVSALLGAERSLRATIKGEIIQDKWFALPDGSGPDFDNPNPDAGEPVEGIQVSLVYSDGTEDVVLANTFTNEHGQYSLTYPVMTATGKQLSLTIGDEDEDDFLVKENVSALNHRWTDFRSSFRWNPDTETLAEQSAGDESFLLPYADDLFIGSSLEYDHNLAVASLGLAAAAMSDPDADSSWTSTATAGRDSNIHAAWSSLGYSVAASSGYNQNLNKLPDKPAYTIAVKTFEDPDVLDEQKNPKKYRVVGVAIRGDVDTAELAQTLVAAEADPTVTGSYRAAAMEILPILERIVNDGWQQDIPTKVWITGFSRGGAIAGQLCDLVRLRSTLNTKIAGLYGYTFGAPGGSKGGYSASTSTSGIFNIVYDEDLIAGGLLENLRTGYKNPGYSLSFGASDVGDGQRRIASAFHMLTGGNSPYDPQHFTADPTLHTFFADVAEARSDVLYRKELQPLMTALLQMSLLHNDVGDDFRTLSLLDKHEQAIAITGHNRVVLNSTSTAQDTLTDTAIEQMMPAILSGAQATFFKALPVNAQENLIAYMGDVLRLAALNSGEGSAFRLSDDMAAIFLPMVLAVSDDFSAPTAQYSSLYGHHPEIYMAWMLGLDGKTLFAQEVPERFNTPVLPVDKNLMGIVIDAESKKPLVNVPVRIVGGVDKDAIDRTLLTDEEGKWDTYVKPADYTVTFELPGFEPKEVRVYQSEMLTRTLTESETVPVSQAELLADKVEMETELQAMEHDSLVITATAHHETGSYYWARIEHPYVYSSKNLELYNIVESIVGPLVDKAHASASKLRNSSHTGCAWDLDYHEEIWFYLGTAYATDDMLSLTLNRGSFSCNIGHNMPNRTGYTFDIATGKRLTLDDLLDPSNPNAKKDFQSQITQSCKEQAGYFDLSEHYSASQIYKSANQQKSVYSWYLLNDGIEMLVPALAGGGQTGFFIPYTRLEGIVSPKYLPAENIGSAQVKPVRVENLLDDYDGQLIYNDSGKSTTGIQLDGLATHVWVDERTSSPVASCSRYFYGYKVKDVTVMLPEGTSAVGVAWTDYLGDHFTPVSVLPEPAEEETTPTP